MLRVNEKYVNTERSPFRHLEQFGRKFFMYRDFRPSYNQIITRKFCYVKQCGTVILKSDCVNNSVFRHKRMHK
jgi:hypothetical protein